MGLLVPVGAIMVSRQDVQKGTVLARRQGLARGQPLWLEQKRNRHQNYCQDQNHCHPEQDGGWILRLAGFDRRGQNNALSHEIP